MGNVAKMLRTGGTNMPTEARQYAGKVLGNKMDYFEQPDIDPRIAAAMLRKQQGAPMPAMQGMQPPGMGDPSQLMANFSTAPDPMQQQYAFQQQPQQGRDIAGLRQRSDDAFTQGMSRLNEEPDIAKYQEFAKKRSAEGGQHLLLALAAQQAGKEFEPIGGMYLKQAMAARDPMQVGKAGMITGEGEFIADPFYQREKQADMLLKRSEYFAKLAETAETQQERAQAAEQARQDRLRSDELMRGQRQQGLDLQRQSIDQRAEDQRNRAVERDQKAKTGDSAQIDKIGSQVYDDYHKNNKDDIQTVSAHQRLKATAQKADAASDISFVYQYMKMLDPGSVVREGEFATAQNATGVPERILNMYNRALKGERLNPDQRAQFLATAERLANDSESRLTQSRSVLERRLRAAGADPAIYLPGWNPAPAGGAAPSGPGTSGSPIRAPQSPTIFKGL
jgi:hypothetical protein